MTAIGAMVILLAGLSLAGTPARAADAGVDDRGMTRTERRGLAIGAPAVAAGVAEQ
jgi:hypothetical protein